MAPLKWKLFQERKSEKTRVFKKRIEIHRLSERRIQTLAVFRFENVKNRKNVTNWQEFWGTWLIEAFIKKCEPTQRRGLSTVWVLSAAVEKQIWKIGNSVTKILVTSQNSKKLPRRRNFKSEINERNYAKASQKSLNLKNFERKILVSYP